MTSGAPSGELTTSRTERCVQGCLQHFDLALLKDKQFVLYCCGNFFGNYGLVAFYVHFVNCAVYKGVDKKEATLLPIIMGSTALISKLIFSFVSNLKCVNRTLEYSVGTLLCGLIIGFTYPVMAFAGLCAIAAAFGIFTSKYCIRIYPQITAKLGWEYRGFNRCHMRPTFNDDVIKWKHFPRYWPFEFTGDRWRPVTRCFGVSFDLHLNKRLSKQSWRRWFGTPSRSLWRHCNGYQFYKGMVSL